MNTNSRFAVAIHILTLMAYRRETMLTSEYIARSVTTHPVVIRRVLGELRRAGLVTSHCGNGGGWRLTRPAEEITLKDAYDAIKEGVFFRLPPQKPDPCCFIGYTIEQALTGYFEEAEAAMERQFAQTTIAAVLERIHTLRNAC